VSESDVYTHGHHDSVLRSHRWRTAENSASYLLDHLRPGLDLLDVGCGPGTITAQLSQRVAPGRTVGIDASAAVVDEATATFTGSHYPGLEFRVDDAYRLDLPDDSVDVVHAHQVLQHLTDPVAALREWARVCRPGGLIAARDADYAAFVWYPADPVLDRWLEVYRAAHQANGSEPDAGRRLLSWAHAAGLDDVRATASTWCYSSPDEREWWADLWADRMTTSAVGEQAIRDGLATAGELADIAAAWRLWAGHPDGWFAVPHGEIIVTIPTPTGGADTGVTTGRTDS